jgi:hypothetical protein
LGAIVVFIGVNIDHFTVHHAVILAILNPTHEHVFSNEEFGPRVKQLQLPLNPGSGLKCCVSATSSEFIRIREVNSDEL